MKTSIIFQIDTTLKAEAVKKLDSCGMSMSEFLRRCLESLVLSDISSIGNEIKTITNAVPDTLR